MSETQLRVDLDVFAANLAVVRAAVAPAELMLVVKDDAYGHGLERIVRRAVADGVRWIGAFDVNDGLAARAVAGDDVRIFSWLTVGDHEIRRALDAQIDLGVGDATFLEDIGTVARAQGSTARIHLKIDTGLHRNGIRPEGWTTILERARSLEDEGLVRVVGVWSHLSEASDADDDAAREVFDSAVAAAVAAGFSLEMRHLAASAASFARPAFRYDLARVGAFCYGIRPADGPREEALGIRPVASLVAYVSHVGEHAVTVNAGSLHGLPSTLARHATIQTSHGKLDVLDIGATHATLTAWPDAEIGDEVTIFGDAGTSATDLAEGIDTIGEEILLRVSPLVPRVYRGD